MTSSLLGPLTFRPILKEKVWGGRRLAAVLGKKLPAGKRIGESWEISAYGNDVSVVAVGPHQGKTLRALTNAWGVRLLGSAVVKRFPGRGFPLLVKYIDARDRLSLQVHPSDAYAARHENRQLGKTEAWYVADAAPGARLIIGLKPGVTRARFRSALAQNAPEGLVAKVPVRTGDALFLPAGRLHAILGGVVLCEIQESSDLTYRVYDWGRQDAARPLHLRQSLVAIDFTPVTAPRLSGIATRHGSNTITHLVACRHFAVEKLMLAKPLAGMCDGRHFECLNVLAGAATLVYANGTQVLKRGDSVLLPATLGRYELRPRVKCLMLRSYVPDIEQDVRKPLQKAGFSTTQIKTVIQP